MKGTRGMEQGGLRDGEWETGAVSIGSRAAWPPVGTGWPFRVAFFHGCCAGLQGGVVVGWVGGSENFEGTRGRKGLRLTIYTSTGDGNLVIGFTRYLWETRLSGTEERQLWRRSDVLLLNVSRKQLFIFRLS